MEDRRRSLPLSVRMQIGGRDGWISGIRYDPEHPVQKPAQPRTRKRSTPLRIKEAPAEVMRADDVPAEKFINSRDPLPGTWRRRLSC